MKSAVTGALALLFVVLVAAPARAHPDVLGALDPSWQQPVSAVTDTGATAPVEVPRVLQIFVYVSGGLAVLLLLSLLRSLVGPRRAAKTDRRRLARAQTSVLRVRAVPPSGR